jgi:hypothetical protein
MATAASDDGVVQPPAGERVASHDPPARPSYSGKSGRACQEIIRPGWTDLVIMGEVIFRIGPPRLGF